VAAGSAAEPRSFKQLFEAADAALYEAKRAGRDGVSGQGRVREYASQ
jgi:PleD family two-component response regulator